MANNPYKNKVVYNGATLIDLTGDTVTPSVLMEGYTAHDASGAPIVGSATGGGVLIEDTTDSHGGTIRTITTTNLVTLGQKSITQNGTYTASDDDYDGYSQVTVNVPSGTDYVVTLSKDNQGNWHTDRTFSEIQTAYNGGKNIVVVADISADIIADGYFYDNGGGSAGFATLIAEYSYDYSAHESTVEYTQYEMYSDGTDYQYAREFYHTFDGDASASDVLSGKIFYNASGRQVGTGSMAPSLQTKSVSYTPSESQQTATVTADSGYDGLNEVNVTVGAVSSTYVGSGITRRSSSDLTASGATVTVPSGYYSTQASKAVASGSATTPATTVTANPSISVSSSGLITATASATKSVTPTVSAGYVSSGTAGTITVSGSNTSQLTTQGATTITPSASSQTAVVAGVYTTGAVTVAAMPSGTAGTPTATKGTVSNHSVTVTPSVTNTTGYITGSTKTGTAVTVSASELVSGSQTITQNGTVDVTNLEEVVVNVSGGGSTKNIQAYIGRASRTANSYGATTATLTVAKTGTYTVSWTAWRSSSSGTMGTNLHRNSTSGTNQQTWTNTYGQQIKLTGQSYTAGDVLTIYATSGSNSRTINVANLIIEEE